MKNSNRTSKVQPSGSRHSDQVIKDYIGLKQRAEQAAAAERSFRDQVLIPLARRRGYRKGGALMLVGRESLAQIVRDAEVVITDQAAARKLPGYLRETYLETVFKPNDRLRELVKNKDGRKLAACMLKFATRACALRRWWRVARAEGTKN